MIDNLRKGWTLSKLGNIGFWTSGGTPLRSKKEYYNGNIPWVKSGELKDRIINNTDEYITQKGLEKSSAKIFDKGTLLIALYGATIGRMGILGIEAATNQACAAFKTYGVKNKYVYYYLLFKRKYLIEKGQGGAQPNISQGILKEEEIPIPPILEQHRIVSKIEELFTKLDAGVGNLRKIQKEIKRYRQAVLKYAFEGKLTAEWRKVNKDKLEPASELLKRIKEERKEALGKKYKELPIIVRSDLSELPKGWEYIRLEESAKVERGKFSYRPRNEPRFYTGQYPFIQTGDIVNANGRIRQFKQTLNEEGLKISKLFKKGTIMVTIAANIGDTAILQMDACATDSVVGVRAYPGIIPEYIEYCLRTKKDGLEKMAPATAQKNINLQILNPLPIPLPSEKEQQKIIEEIERLFSVADEVEQVIEKSLKEAERLRQSILKIAFEGRLVPQDPNDEPAEKLLERIKAELEAGRQKAEDRGRESEDRSQKPEGGKRINSKKKK